MQCNAELCDRRRPRVFSTRAIDQSWWIRASDLLGSRWPGVTLRLRRHERDVPDADEPRRQTAEADDMFQIKNNWDASACVLLACLLALLQRHVRLLFLYPFTNLHSSYSRARFQIYDDGSNAYVSDAFHPEPYTYGGTGIWLNYCYS